MTRGGIALVAAILLVPSLALRAAPLDKDGCAKLKTEQGQLEHAGTRSGMGRGPEWAKANLAPDKLEQIKRLIEVDEQLLFRCQGRPLVNLPQDPDAAAEKDVPKRPVPKKAPDAAKKAPPVKKAAAPAAAPKAVTKPAAKKDGAPGTDAADKAKAKPKSKANDAYRPQPLDWSANPFPADPAKK